MKKPTIKAMRNIWGNWNCYVGTRQVEKFDEEWDAQRWLNEQMATGNYTLSDKSELRVENK